MVGYFISEINNFFLSSTGTAIFKKKKKQGREKYCVVSTGIFQFLFTISLVFDKGEVTWIFEIWHSISVLFLLFLFSH